MISSKTSKYIDSYLGILILSLLIGSIVYDPVFFFLPRIERYLLFNLAEGACVYYRRVLLWNVYL